MRGKEEEREREGGVRGGGVMVVMVMRTSHLAMVKPALRWQPHTCLTTNSRVSAR